MGTDILIGLLTGLISGLLSGYFVYLFTKHREKKYEIYQFCIQFLFNTLEKCEMYIPYKDLHYLFYVNKDKNSLWRKSIQKIIDFKNPFGHENRVMSDKENELVENISTALTELDKWKKKNHLK